MCPRVTWVAGPVFNSSNIKLFEVFLSSLDRLDGLFGNRKFASLKARLHRRFLSRNSMQFFSR